LVGASVIFTSVGNSDGQIHITGSGGTPPYMYSLDGFNYQADSNFTGLNAGNYTIHIIDFNGCTQSIVVTVGENTGLNYTTEFAVQIYPNPSSGLFQILVSGVSSIRISVFNVMGSLIEVQNYFVDSSGLGPSIDLRKKSSGLYYVEVLNHSTGDRRILPVLLE
jgi:hypothetical protein